MHDWQQAVGVGMCVGGDGVSGDGCKHYIEPRQQQRALSVVVLPAGLDGDDAEEDAANSPHQKGFATRVRRFLEGMPVVRWEEEPAPMENCKASSTPELSSTATVIDEEGDSDSVDSAVEVCTYATPTVGSDASVTVNESQRQTPAVLRLAKVSASGGDNSRSARLHAVAEKCARVSDAHDTAVLSEAPEETRWSWSADDTEVQPKGWDAKVDFSALSALYYPADSPETASSSTAAAASRPCRPQRVRLERCKRPKHNGAFLRQESSELLKKVVRMNAHAGLLTKGLEVRSAFAKVAGPSILDVYSRVSADGNGGSGLRRLLLPGHVAHGDDAKVAESPARLAAASECRLRELNRYGYSLTSVSLSVPSVWHQEALVKDTPDLRTESFQILESKTAEEPAAISTTAHSKRTPSRKGTADEFEQSPAMDGGTLTTALQTAAKEPLSVEQPEAIEALESKTSTKLVVAPEDNMASTDYFVSDAFLSCNWGELTASPGSDSAVALTEGNSGQQPGYRLLLQQLARPALWDLVRKKQIRVDGTSLRCALDLVSVKSLEAVICTQQREVKRMSLNPSASSHDEIVEACSSLRQAVWLHALRLVSMAGLRAQGSEKAPLSVVVNMLPSAKYRLAMGPSNWKNLSKLFEVLGGRPDTPVLVNETSEVAEGSGVGEIETDPQPPVKKRKVFPEARDTTPIRIVCSAQLLENVDLLDELCTEHQVSFIERDLPPPIDMLVDERNCICVLSQDTFHAEASVRELVYKLVRLQVQFKKVWFIIALDDLPETMARDNMQLFYAALVQFRAEVQTITSQSVEETSRCVRTIIDSCAEIALATHRILPRVWSERRFLLEEESQFERFLVSTQVVSHYSAQSLLHKISMAELLAKSAEELKPLVQASVTDDQLQLLWRMIHQNHGLRTVMA